MRNIRLLLLAAALIAPGVAIAQALEQQVKAAFLFRFLSFVEWPPQALGPPGSPLVIAVLGADDVHAELRQIVTGRLVNERPVVVERLQDAERPARAHIVFVGREAAAHLRKLPALATLLIVADWENALAEGAMINFVVRENRVRFEVAPDHAERRGLRLSARMLSVALDAKGGR